MASKTPKNTRLTKLSHLSLLIATVNPSEKYDIVQFYLQRDRGKNKKSSKVMQCQLSSDQNSCSLIGTLLMVYEIILKNNWVVNSIPYIQQITGYFIILPK